MVDLGVLFKIKFLGLPVIILVWEGRGQRQVGTLLMDWATYTLQKDLQCVTIRAILNNKELILVVNKS